MAIPSKDTIYIDIDDEITGIINKMQDSGNKVVALVLPKRASVLQSIVNMRLLKRAADESKKSVVLITSEAGLLPLAGAAGVFVAKTLDSKPSIPTAPLDDDKEETVDEDSAGTVEDRDTEITVANAGAIAVGALAGLPPKDEVETLELDDEDEVTEGESDENKHIDFKAPEVKKDAKLKIPNFDRFRLMLFGIGTLVILLIAGFIYANNVLPKAVITISTDAIAVNASVNTTLSSTATAVDQASNTVPAKLVSEPKTYTQQAIATGQKNTGTKATGSITMTAQACAPNLGQPNAVPAGTGVSSGGLTFITQTTTHFSPSGTSVPNSGSCLNYAATAATDIIAQGGGTNYNITSGTFKVAGRADVTATGSTTGGTDQLVQVLSQADVDGATAKIVTDNSTVKQNLATQLSKANYFAVLATFSTGTPVITTSANVGDTVANVTVTEVVTYTMFGAKETDLTALINNNIKTQIDTAKQSVLNSGLSTGTFTLQSSTATTAIVTMDTTAEVGPQLNPATIKKQVAGKKTGDVKSMLQGNPDVTGVDVKLSPFWVTSVPKNTSKITVIIAKPSKVTTTNATTP